MEYYNKTLCVTFGELAFGDEPIIRINTLNSLLYRDRVERICRAGGEGSCALINYSTLPDKYKRLYEERYGNPEELLKQQQMKSKLKLDEKARQYFEAFEYDLNGVQTHLSERLKSEYTINASVLNLLSNQLNDRIAFTKALTTVPAECGRL